MKYNKQRKIREKKRERIINNLSYPFEFSEEFVEDAWIECYILGNFGLTYEDIKDIFERYIRDKKYTIKRDGNTIFLKRKNITRILRVFELIKIRSEHNKLYYWDKSTKSWTEYTENKSNYLSERIAYILKDLFKYDDVEIQIKKSKNFIDVIVHIHGIKIFERRTLLDLKRVNRIKEQWLRAGVILEEI